MIVLLGQAPALSVKYPSSIFEVKVRGKVLYARLPAAKEMQHIRNTLAQAGVRTTHASHVMIDSEQQRLTSPLPCLAAVAPAVQGPAAGGAGREAGPTVRVRATRDGAAQVSRGRGRVT